MKGFIIGSTLSSQFSPLAIQYGSPRAGSVSPRVGSLSTSFQERQRASDTTFQVWVNFVFVASDGCQLLGSLSAFGALGNPP